MKIAVLGAGFAGLSCAYHLSKKGHNVTLIEKEDNVGGLAAGFKKDSWKWNLEKHYHHFFTNDVELINLAKELKISLTSPTSLTCVCYRGKIFPFNKPVDILTFSPLSFTNRFRFGLVSLFLKLLPMSLGQKLEKFTAWGLARNLYGKVAFSLIWQPLLEKKFGEFAKQVNAGWLWARIKKRTIKLGYIQSGFQALAGALAKKIEGLGGKIWLNTEVKQIGQREDCYKVALAGPALRNSVTGLLTFDAIISTLPNSVFTKIAPGLPKKYAEKLNSIPHLHAINLILELKEPFLKGTYWLNINDKSFPFLCLVEHTNFIDKKYYGGSHILYISNYLPNGHPYLQKSAAELLKIYLPFLKKINPKFIHKSLIINLKSFIGLFAQPVFLPDYSKIRPFGKTPIPNLYLANLDSVYPWDRGTNYALEVGRKIAELISDEK